MMNGLGKSAVSIATDRIYSKIEHRADVVIHVLGALFAVNATAWLLAHISGSATLIASVTVYCLGLLAMIFASAAYNIAPLGPTKQVLRRLDHAAIFIMIAATYTPFAANRLSGFAGPVILAAIWICASIGGIGGPNTSGASPSPDTIRKPSRRMMSGNKSARTESREPRSRGITIAPPRVR